MTLLQGKVGQSYVVLSSSMDRDTETRLEVMGLTSGTAIQVLNKKGNGSMIIKVRGTRLAVGKKITGHIQIA